MNNNEHGNNGRRSNGPGAQHREDEKGTAKRPAEASVDKVVPADKVRAILEERARALAKATQVQAGEATQVVVFSLANEKYGISTDYVREVQPLRDVTPVPCTPSFVVGIINIRGAIYSVIDIREFFGVPEQPVTPLTKVILVDAAELVVGIRADDVSGAKSVPLAEIKPPLDSRGGGKEEYIQGVTKDMLIILDLEALLRDERIVVHREVS